MKKKIFLQKYINTSTSGCFLNDSDQTKPNHDFYYSTARNSIDLPFKLLPLPSPTKEKKLNEPFHYFDIKCNARVIEAGCSARQHERLFTMFPLKHERLPRAELHGWVRTRDVSLIGLMTHRQSFGDGGAGRIEMFGWLVIEDASQEGQSPLLVTALTAHIINGFFTRNCRSLARCATWPRSIPRKITFLVKKC